MNLSAAPISPLDLSVGSTYHDRSDGFTFEVAEIEVKGVMARITPVVGEPFCLGGLYGRIHRVR